MAQLKDLGIKLIRDMSTEELLEKVKEIRKNKLVTRPAHQKKVKQESDKKVRKVSKGLSSLLDGMTEEEKAALIKQLEEDTGESDANTEDDSTE